MTDEQLLDGFGEVPEGKRLAPPESSVATLPLQLRTSYAVGGISGCETVISVTNFSDSTIDVEVEFFTGFNYFQRGIAKLVLKTGETGELSTTRAVPPYVINAVRDSDAIFEGYANIHAATSEIGAQANMVCGLDSEVRTYEDLNVFRPPFQHGD